MNKLRLKTVKKLIPGHTVSEGRARSQSGLAEGKVVPLTSAVLPALLWLSPSSAPRTCVVQDPGPGLPVSPAGSTERGTEPKLREALGKGRRRA